MRKFSDTINELADVALLDKGAEPLALRQHIVGWVRENWLAGKFDISGHLNGEGMLKVVPPDPFLHFFMDVGRTGLVWRLHHRPEGKRLPRNWFWGDLAISDDAAAQLRDAIAGRLSPADAPAGAAPSIPSAPEHPANSQPSSQPSGENRQSVSQHGTATPSVDRANTPDELAASPADADIPASDEGTSGLGRRKARTRRKLEMYQRWRELANEHCRNADGTRRTRRQILQKIASDARAKDPDTGKLPNADSVKPPLDYHHPGWIEKSWAETEGKKFPPS